MNSLSYKTVSANKATVKKEWFVVDAAGQTVGRISSEIAKIIRGKNKPSYTPHVDCGDNVIIINCEQVVFTGNKMKDKEYVRYTGHPGGQRFARPIDIIKKHPRRILESSVRGMLPKTKLGDALIKNLFVYAGAEHPHAAQQPKTISFINTNN